MAFVGNSFPNGLDLGQWIITIYRDIWKIHTKTEQEIRITWKSGNLERANQDFWRNNHKEASWEVQDFNLIRGKTVRTHQTWIMDMAELQLASHIICYANCSSPVRSYIWKNQKSEKMLSPMFKLWQQIVLSNVSIATPCPRGSKFKPSTKKSLLCLFIRYRRVVCIRGSKDRRMCTSRW